MKYFTKEWYALCQNSNWHLNMSVSKNAEEFNEDYYKDLYTRRRRAFVKEQKEVAEVLGEEFSKAKAEVQFMENHEKIGDDLYKVTYSDGTVITVDYIGCRYTVQKDGVSRTVKFYIRRQL